MPKSSECSAIFESYNDIVNSSIDFSIKLEGYK